jgi:hypothetical protein
VWQKDSFSCLDTHAFNRVSTAQVTAWIRANKLSIVTGRFTERLSLLFLSLQEAAWKVILANIAGN